MTRLQVVGDIGRDDRGADRFTVRSLQGRPELAPGLVARELIDEEHVSVLGPQLRRWNGRAHVELTRSGLYGLVNDRVGVESTRPQLVRDVEASLHGLAPERPELPDPDLVVDCDGNAANVRTGEMRPATPADNVVTHLSVPFARTTDRAAIQRFLADITTPEFVPLVAELIGLAVSSWRDLQTIFWLHGPPGSGKSTLMRLLDATRAEAVPAVSPHEQAANRFAGGQLVGAGLNLVPDVSARDLTEPAFLKAATGQDRVFVDFKNREPRAVTLWALNVFASNSPPAISDPDDALGRRVVPIPCSRQSSSKPDPDLTAKLSTRENLSALVMIGLEALYELRQRGHLTTNPSTEAARADFRQQTNAVALFLAEACVIDGDATIRRSELWTAFRAWADDSRKGQKMGRTAFLRSIEADHGITFKKRQGEFVADGIRLDLGRHTP